ncbi:MAG TPA: ATP-binding protein [Geobacteraceae bacterium]|nr:ATP-binding protein [Geobacteraceae bacterium]
MNDKNIKLAVFLTFAVFVVDIATPVWYDSWALYLIPMFFMFRSARRPYLHSVAITLLIAAGLRLHHPDKTALIHAGLSRITGTLGGWGVSLLLMRLKLLNESLKRAGNELEKRVENRTAELERAIRMLRKENEERIQAQEALRDSEEFIRSVLDNVDDCFLVVDRDFNIVTANRAFCGWVGVPAGKMIGRNCREADHICLKSCRAEGERCLMELTFETGEPHRMVHKLEDAKGNIHYFETRIFPLKNASGAVTSAIKAIHDITEHHLLEAEQLRSQKLEAVGILAGGIAHDFNNLLQGVFGYISLAKIRIDGREKAHAMLEQAEKALNLSKNLTNQLLTFSKGGNPAKKRIRLGPLIENTVKFALSGSSCDCRLTVDEKLMQVEADEGQIGQVIQNIVLNASEAMVDGGTITITARNAELPGAGNPLPAEGGRFVNICISDTGMGIPEKYLTRIFDPYFTTKKKGSGLGLATSYSIVKNHGGAIDVKSKVGEGTTFNIFLPATEAEEEEGSHPAVSTPQRKGKVLIMDDEELIRSVATEMMEFLGHEVESAEDGESAIEKFRQATESGRPFDVVILDITVKGGMGGELAIKMLREMDPHIKAIVSSGYSDSPVASDYRAYGFTSFLNKPYQIEELRESLNALFSS